MGAPNFIKAAIIKSVLSDIASNNDTKTTVLGAGASTLIALNIDYGKLFQKDPTEIAKVVAAVIVFLFGYYTNKHSQPPAAK